jgi:predicted MFS family arabinose efflux permease
MAQDIHVVILGRIIQGAGAISAAVMALAADLTRDEQRTKAMAIIGMTIGVAFALSMVGGPVLNRWIGVPGIFALTGVLALTAILVVRFFVPAPAMATGAQGMPSQMRFAEILRHPQLLRLNYGIFILNAVLMALWVVVPFELRAAGLPGESHWQIYLPVMVMSVVLMVPPMLISERTGRQKAAFLGAIGVLLAAQLLLLGLFSSLWGLAFALLAFFTGFNFLEASLPSMISRTAPPGARGAAVGVYSSAQFLGSFVGAWTGGAISQHLGMPSVFAFCAALTFSWLIVAVGMQALPGFRTRTYAVPKMDTAGAEGLSKRLAGVPGVREASVFAGEGLAHLKVDNTRFDERNVLKLLSGEV